VLARGYAYAGRAASGLREPRHDTPPMPWKLHLPPLGGLVQTAG
jgi:hypothetical protein